MTPKEFKAWFDGFTEAMSGTPTKAQWARIKERVDQIDGKETTERVFIDRYWPHYLATPICTYPTYTPLGWPTINCTSNTLAGAADVTVAPTTSMYSLGVVDAQLLNVS